MRAYSPIARLRDTSSENRIHSDDVAQRYGFSGGLVPGVAVFGYMTRPLLDALGTEWLGHGLASVRFIKPAYDGDKLTIQLEELGGNRHQVRCFNERSELLAELVCEIPEELPPVDERAYEVGASALTPRVEITSAAIDLGRPFAAFTCAPSAEENRSYADQVDDDAAAYRAGLVHPHLILHWSNQTLVRRFIMPAWIHVGSEIRFRRALRVGDAIQISAIPIEKWERKGHEFVKLYIAYRVDGEPATEVYHTAIYRIAQKL